MVVFSFPFGLVNHFLHLQFFIAPVVSTDYPLLEVKWQPLCFCLLAFWWDIVTAYATGLAIQGGNLTPTHRGCRYLDDFS